MCETVNFDQPFYKFLNMISPFILFGIEHILAVTITVAVIALVTLRLQKYYANSLWRTFNKYLAVIILLEAIGSKIAAILRNEFLLSEDLPFHLCGISRYLIILYLIRPNQKLFNILFYWISCGSTLALIFPDLKRGFPSLDFLLFFLSHGLPLFTMLYLVWIQKKRPDKRSFNTAFFVMNVVAFLIVLPINLLTDGNYLYLFQVPNVDFQPIKILPPWPWYLLLFELFIYGVFRLAYYPFLRYPETKKEKILI